MSTTTHMMVTSTSITSTRSTDSVIINVIVSSDKCPKDN